MKRALNILGVVFLVAVLLTLTQVATRVDRVGGSDCDFVCEHTDCSYSDPVEAVEGIEEVLCTVENCECGWDEGDGSVAGECEFVEGVEAVDESDGVACDSICTHNDCAYLPSSVEVDAGTFRDIADIENAFFKGVFSNTGAWAGTLIFWKYIALAVSLLIVGGVGLSRPIKKLLDKERLPVAKTTKSKSKTKNETRMSNPRQFKRVEPKDEE